MPIVTPIRILLIDDNERDISAFVNAAKVYNQNAFSIDAVPSIEAGTQLQQVGQYDVIVIKLSSSAEISPSHLTDLRLGNERIPILAISDKEDFSLRRNLHSFGIDRLYFKPDTSYPALIRSLLLAVSAARIRAPEELAQSS